MAVGGVTLACEILVVSTAGAATAAAAAGTAIGGARVVVLTNGFMGVLVVP